jgi:hypothetical protein
MKLQDIEKKFPPFDKPAGEAAYLISTRRFEKYETPYNPKTPDLQWHVQIGDRVDDMQYPPSLGYKCGACGSLGRISGPNATAQIVRHCLIAESVPEHIAAEYTRLRAAYLKKYPTKVKFNTAPAKRDKDGKLIFKDPRSAADIARDNVVAAQLGLKSSEVLLAEAQQAAALAARMK